MRKQTYYIITIGCQMNKSDSERIAGYLEKHGFVLSKNKDKADLVVFTTCGVRQSAEDRVYGLVPKLKKNNPKVKIILTGCLSGREDVKKRLKKYVDIWLPITELEGLADKFDLLKKDEGSLKNYLRVMPKYKSSFSAFIPIGNGCDNFCAYCVVPHARGREVYRDAEEILGEVKNLVKNSYKEIILIAQNVNSYKSGNKKHKTRNIKQVEFSDLLKMVNNVPGDFWVRFATSHPKDMSDDLIKAIAECDKICEHIHLPAQSGDDGVLRRMNRKYTIKHYLGLISRIRSKLDLKKSPQPPFVKGGNELWNPPVSITTDIIVGFPGETRKQFDNTAKLFREAKFDMAYIAQYSPRFGTASYNMKDDISKQEKKKREEELMSILRKTALANNKKYLKKTVEVLVAGHGKDGKYFGKTRTDKHVTCNMKHEADLIGKFIKVKVEKVRDFGLEGNLV